MRIWKIAKKATAPTPVDPRVSDAARKVIENKKTILEVSEEYFLDPAVVSEEVSCLRKMEKLPVEEIQRLKSKKLPPKEIASRLLGTTVLDVVWVIRKTMPLETVSVLPEEKSEIFKLLDRGKTREEIAVKMGLTYWTVTSIIKRERGPEHPHSQDLSEFSSAIYSEYKNMIDTGVDPKLALQNIISRYPLIPPKKIWSVLYYRGFKRDIKPQYKHPTGDDAAKVVALRSSNPSLSFSELSKMVGFHSNTLRRAVERLLPGWYDKNFAHGWRDRSESNLPAIPSPKQPRPALAPTRPESLALPTGWRHVTWNGSKDSGQRSKVAGGKMNWYKRAQSDEEDSGLSEFIRQELGIEDAVKPVGVPVIPKNLVNPDHLMKGHLYEWEFVEPMNREDHGTFFGIMHSGALVFKNIDENRFRINKEWIKEISEVE